MADPAPAPSAEMVTFVCDAIDAWVEDSLVHGVRASVDAATAAIAFLASHPSERERLFGDRETALREHAEGLIAWEAEMPRPSNEEAMTAPDEPGMVRFRIEAVPHDWPNEGTLWHIGTLPPHAVAAIFRQYADQVAGYNGYTCRPSVDDETPSDACSNCGGGFYRCSRHTTPTEHCEYCDASRTPETPSKDRQ